MKTIYRTSRTVTLHAAALVLWSGCHGEPPPVEAPAHPRRAERERLVRDHIAARNISDPRVLEALRTVPRHRFIPEEQSEFAYEDRPLIIGHEQTISQPYVVAFMTEALQLRSGEKVLEIGTGSGYQAAVLAEVGATVYSIEIVEALAQRARDTLRELGYEGIHLRHGDGYRGWPSEAPFDAVLLTAAPDHVPQPLLDQLAVGGRVVLPVGPKDAQRLVRISRTESGYEREELLGVRFVPMTGEALR